MTSPVSFKCRTIDILGISKHIWLEHELIGSTPEGVHGKGKESGHIHEILNFTNNLCSL